MRVVIDEGVPRHLVQALRERGFDASRFRRGWTSLANGQLLDAVEAEGFAVLVTDDKNIATQQNLAKRDLAIVALPHNKRRLIIEHVDDIADTLRRVGRGQHVVMGLDGTRRVTWIADGRSVTEEMPPVAIFTL